MVDHVDPLFVGMALLGLEIIEQSTKKVRLTKAQMKATQDRQKVMQINGDTI